MTQLVFKHVYSAVFLSSNNWFLEFYLRMEKIIYWIYINYLRKWSFKRYPPRKHVATDNIWLILMNTILILFSYFSCPSQFLLRILINFVIIYYPRVSTVFSLSLCGGETVCTRSHDSSIISVHSVHSH